MEIVQTLVNVTYPLVMNYRKKYFGIEDSLSGYFRPANIISVPDMVNPEIPRIVIPTLNGHSIVNVSLVEASMATRFDGDYTSNWEHCKEYLMPRMDLVYGMIDALTEGKKDYTGFVTHLKYLDDDEKSLDMLKKSLFRNGGADLGDMCEASCKLIYKYKDKYYINVKVESVRDLAISKTEEGQDILKEKGSSHIRIELDVNDRLAANSIKGYKTDKSVFSELMDISSDFVKDKLEALLKTGRIAYGD